MTAYSKRRYTLELVKNNHFISFVVALALCFGQLASNAHVLSHFSQSQFSGEAQHSEHAELGHSHHIEPMGHALAHAAHDPKSHVGHHKSDYKKLEYQKSGHKKSSHQAGTDNLDCAIYHIVAGSTGLTSARSGIFAAHYKCVEAVVAQGLLLPSIVSDTPNNRGPPLLS